MIKYLAALLLATQVFAGLPPTNLSGQGSATSPTTFKFKTPPNQATQVSGVESLIETGNSNIIANPGFEGSTGWTASGGTFTYSSSSPLSGAKSGLWNSDSAAQTLTGTAITIPEGLKDQSGFVTCRIQTASGTATHTMAVYDGSTNIFSTTVNSSTAGELTSLKIKFPSSGTVAIRFTSVASNEPEIKIDSCFIGPPTGTDVVDNNFIRLSSKWTDTGAYNSNAEGSVGSWLAYADAAGTQPVDMTGGSPNITCDRTTTAGEILNGLASFRVTKGSANRQGEGCATTLNIPSGYSGKRALIRIPYRVTSGSVVQDDVKVFLYDVTNAAVIVPFNNDLLGSNGTIYAVYDVPNSTSNIQMRVGFHFASTSATAVTFTYDDAFVGALESPASAVVSAWQSYTPVFTGFGTVTVSNFKYRLVGSVLEIMGTFTSGTVSATEARISFPGNFTTESDYPTISNAGVWFEDTSTATHGGAILAEASTSYMTFGTDGTFGGSTINPLSKVSGSTLASTTIHSLTASFRVQSVGTATLTQSSSFLISNYLATGTRVTGAAPTGLGQYRSYLRNSSANTFTETNGDPTTTPSATNGVLIYRNTAWATVNANNQPTKYEIFVGKYKAVKWMFFSTTGRTGVIDVTPSQYTSTILTGYVTNYDPTTGIATIVAPANSASTTAANTGFDGTGAALTSDVYFDILVSESANPMSIVAPRSYVIVDGSPGRGSSNDSVVRFSNIRANVGPDITYADSSTLGGSFTINSPGIYTAFGNLRHAASNSWAITVNGTALTTSVDAPLTYAQGARVLSQEAAGQAHAATATLFLSTGDVVRVQNAEADPVNSATTMFGIIKVSN